ncbi:DUF1501 domain-containing protein [Silanimonas sp.]|jgi:uncharacterized protein (DUF1501 family)|uniref:DUF1501 domain-containing protein n=1 Tax=Silanimonas sp. TaxID=1929290 RepID=UPI0037C7BEF5
MDRIDKANERRRFLAGASRIALGSAAAMATMGQLQMVHAATRSNEKYKALVCVYLFGGNDSFNMVVPRSTTAYGTYNAARPALAIPQANLLPITPTAGAGGVDWGLNPAMPELRALFESGRAGLIGNVGPLVTPTTKSDYQNRRVPLPPELFSHVDQQSYSMSMGSETAAKAGWGGRLADRLQAAGFGSSTGLPIGLTMSGANAWLAGSQTGMYTLGSSGPSRIDASLRTATDARSVARRTAFNQLLDAAQRDSSAFVREHGRMNRRAIDFSESVFNAINNVPAPATVFPTGRFGDTLRTVARTIAARGALGQRRQIFFVGLGGWDTHDGQPVDHPRLLTTVSQGLAAFYNATIELGVSRDVTTFTMSDFGRTLNNNGDGTDHGWGGHSWILGGDVVGRRIYGTMPDYALGSSQDVGRGRMIPTTPVEQLGSTLARWFGLGFSDANEIFPNVRNFGNTGDYLPMLASTNAVINDVGFTRNRGGGKG